MALDPLLTQPVRQTAAQIRSGEVTPTQLAELVLDRIAATDADLKAYTHVRAERARDDARRAERELRDGHDRGPLHGLPVSVKDLVDMTGAGTGFHRQLTELQRQRTNRFQQLPSSYFSRIEHLCIYAKRLVSLDE